MCPSPGCAACQRGCRAALKSLQVASGAPWEDAGLPTGELIALDMKCTLILQGLEYCMWKAGISSAIYPCCALSELSLFFPHLWRHAPSYVCCPLPAVWLLGDVIFAGLCGCVFALSSQWRCISWSLLPKASGFLSGAFSPTATQELLTV